MGPEDEGPAEDFGFRSVAGGIDELAKEVVGNRVAIHQEGRYGDFTDRAFSIVGECVWVVGAHQETSAVQRDHALEQLRGHFGRHGRLRGEVLGCAFGGGSAAGFCGMVAGQAGAAHRFLYRLQV